MSLSLKKNGTTTTTTAASSSSISTSNNKNSKERYGLDTTFQQGGKRLRVGEKFSVKLYKGPAVSGSGDPVDPKAAATKFPLIAKFPPSVVRPDFTEHPWKTARLYQQDVPQVTPDSDEEDDDNDENGATKKRRWRYYNRQHDGSYQPRQWVLQEEVDFLETMVSRREQRSGGGKNNSDGGDDTNSTFKTKSISSRYEGVPESSTSHYAMLRVDRSTGNVTVQLLPAQVSTITFHQPSARKALTLSQAEQVIQDQRMGLRSSVLMERTDRDKIKKEQLAGAGGDNLDGTAGGGADSTSVTKKPLLGGGFRSPSAIRAAALKSTKGRLLQKFKEADKDDLNIDEGDDVMGDVAFRNRKGGGAARKELLTSLGDGLAVSYDGVIGGSNDAAFAGKQKFGKLQLDDTNPGNSGSGGNANGDDDGYGNNNNDNTGTDRDTGTGADGGNERGADGAAMADDFYTRDVGAEYEELDYDANEQFDDDDVDLGEAEVMIDSSNNFGGEDDDNDDGESSEEDDDDSEVGGAEGLASVAGFKALLAKARGEAIPHLQQQLQNSAGSGTDGGTNNNDNSTTLLPTDGSTTGTNDGKGINGNNASSNDGTGNNNNLLNSKKNNRSPDSIKKEQQKRKRDELANDHFSKIFAAAELANAKETKKKQRNDGNFHIIPMDSDNDDTSSRNGAGVSSTTQSSSASALASSSSSAAATPAGGGIQVDENGFRLITLQAVQKEIWLNHGSITTKRLMKLFDVKKKSSELRQGQFRDMVKELCTMKTDPIKGRMLVLKQHYSNMG